MRFKEIFNKYINNKASEEEIEIVEDEIEKIELINDYLVEKIEDEFIKNSIRHNNELDKDINENNKNNEDEVLKEIKRAINIKLMKVGITSSIIVFSLLLSLKFIVSPIMNKVYYNPQEKIYYNSKENIDEMIMKMDLDLELFSELHFPGASNTFTDYKPLGFGKYDIQIRQQNYFKSDDKIYNARLDKNNFEVDYGFYKYPYANSFSRDMIPFYKYPTDDDEHQIEELKKIPDYINVKANISFNKDLSMEEVQDLIKYKNIDTYWIGIRSCDPETQRYPLMGMAPDVTGILFSEESIDTEKYPYLDLGWVKYKEINEDILETHYKSMLKYMSDNKDFGKTNILFEHTNLFYKEALDYINKNGVMSYGIVVGATPNEILELRKNPLVECVNVVDIKLSSLQ